MQQANVHADAGETPFIPTQPPPPGSTAYFSERSLDPPSGVYFVKQETYLGAPKELLGELSIRVPELTERQTSGTTEHYRSWETGTRWISTRKSGPSLITTVRFALFRASKVGTFPGETRTRLLETAQ
jgi:hypothetical protein